MNRFVYSLLGGFFLLFSVTLISCDNRKVVEIPGESAEVSLKESQPVDENAAGMDDAAMAQLQEKLFGKKDLTGKEIKEAQAVLENLRKFPEDHSAAALMKYLMESGNLDQNTRSYLAVMPHDEREAISNEIMSNLEKAADMILADEKATHDDLAKVSLMKANFIAMDFISGKEGASDRFAQLEQALEKRGEPVLAWEIALTRLTIELERFQQTAPPTEAEIEKMVNTASELAERGNTLNTLTDENLELFQFLIGILGMERNPLSEARNEEAVNRYLETLKKAKPHEKLQESTLQQAITDLELRKLSAAMFSVLKEEGKTTDVAQKDYDAFLDTMIGMLNRAKTRKSLSWDQAVYFLQLITLLEPYAGREKLIEAGEALLGAAEASPSPQIAQSIDIFHGMVRRQKLVGNEMSLEALKPDGTPVSLKNFAGKTVLVDFWTAQSVSSLLSEMESLRKAYSVYHDAGFEILGISVNRMTAEEIGAFAKKEDIPWTLATLDTKTSDAEKQLRSYGIFMIPASFLISPDGKVIALNVYGEKLFEELKKIYPDVEVPPEPEISFPVMENPEAEAGPVEKPEPEAAETAAEKTETEALPEPAEAEETPSAETETPPEPAEETPAKEESAPAEE